MASPSSPSQSTLNDLLDGYSISETQLSIKCDERLFCDLSDKVAFTLRSLVTRLRLTAAEFQQIEKDHEKDYKRQVIEVFQKWRNKNLKNEATYLNLIKVFIEETNMEGAEYVIEYFKSHHPLPIPKCHSWTNGHSKSRRKSSETVAVRRLSYQESQRCITRRLQRRSSHTCSTWRWDKPYKPTSGHRKSNSFSAGNLQHNNISSQTFDFFCDDLVTILSSDRALFHQFVELVTSDLLTHPIEKEKSLRNPCLVIGCKTLINDVWTFINRARNPERALQRVLLILIQIVQVADIAHKIEARALESGARCSLHGDVAQKIKNKDHGQLATICVPDIPVAHDSTLEVTDNLIRKYANKLRKYYRDLPASPKWSPAKNREYVDLVALSLENESKEEASLLPLADLFNVPHGSSVLIEGIPGIGKSTLAYEMCKRWADGSALQEYSLILLLRLRDDSVQRNWSPDKLQELIGIYLNMQSWKSELVQNIIDDDGESLLIILEGFDELPEEKQLDFGVLDRIKCDLSEATIIVTTRTCSAHELSKKIRFKKHIEIQGFNQANQNCCIKSFFKDNKEKQESFKQYIDRYPVISGCLYIPLNLVVLLEIFLSHKFSELPKTMTELYELLIKMLIYREMESEVPAGTQVRIPSLREIPDPATQKAFYDLCYLAYDGITGKLNSQKRVVFYKPEKYKTLGLMRREVKVLPNEGGDMYAYSFLHLTIQEFLAAYHIYGLSSNEIQKHFNKHNSRYKMFVTMRFLAGLTEFEGKNHVTVPHERISSLHIFHQLMEIKNEELVSQILNQRKEITVSRVSSVMTEYDFYVLGKCIGLSISTWRFGFTLRALTDKHMKMLVSGFESVKRVSSHPHVKHIGLSLNQLGNDGVSSILSLPPLILGTTLDLNLRATTISQECLPYCIPKIEHFLKLETFLFHDNEFKEGEQQPLIDNLCRLKKLKKVSFSSLNPAECITVLTVSQSIRQVEFYELSLPSIEAVLATLSQCRTLECIEIYQSRITSEAVGRMSTQSLPPSLKELKLNNCAIDSNTACIIFDAVIRYSDSLALKILDLGDNIFDDKGGCHLACLIPLILERSLPLNGIFLHHNNFSEITINKLIDRLACQAWYSKVMVIYLSLQWEGTVNQIIKRSPIKRGALKHFEFKRPDMHSCTST